MTEPTYGIAIDASTDTVVLVGADFIRMLVGSQGQGQSIEDFNRIAVKIVKQHGPAYGVDLETTDLDNWALACTTEEDTLVLLSYLGDPSSEVTLKFTEQAIAPIESKEPCLH